MKIHKSFKNLERSDIIDIQLALNVTLPKEYAEFLITKHAFTIHTNWIKVNGRDLFFSNFLPYYHKENTVHLVDFNLQIMNSFKGYLMIGRGYSDDAYLLKVTKPEYGSVHYLRLDNTMEEGGLLIANSFNQFCDILTDHETYGGPDF